LKITILPSPVNNNSNNKVFCITIERPSAQYLIHDQYHNRDHDTIVIVSIWTIDIYMSGLSIPTILNIQYFQLCVLIIVFVYAIGVTTAITFHFFLPLEILVTVIRPTTHFVIIIVVFSYDLRLVSLSSVLLRRRFSSVTALATAASALLLQLLLSTATLLLYSVDAATTLAASALATSTLACSCSRLAATIQTINSLIY